MEVVISPKVYSKLMHLCRAFDTEVGAWGISKSAKDPLHITECALTLQTSTNMEIDWDSEDIAEFRRHCREERKLNADQFSHVTLHTHPGMSADPSKTDWDHLNGNLMNVLVADYLAMKEAKKPARAPWLIMCIFAKNRADMTANLLYYLDDPPLQEILASKIGITVAWSGKKERECWEAEYHAKVMSPSQAKQIEEVTSRPFPIHDPGRERVDGAHLWDRGGIVTTRSGGRVYDPDDPIDATTLQREEEQATIIQRMKLGTSRLAHRQPEVLLSAEEAADWAEVAEVVQVDDDWDFLSEEQWKAKHDDLAFCKHVIMQGGAQFGIENEDQLADNTDEEIKEYAYIIRTALAEAVVSTPLDKDSKEIELVSGD